MYRVNYVRRNQNLVSRDFVRHFLFRHEVDNRIAWITEAFEKRYKRCVVEKHDEYTEIATPNREAFVIVSVRLVNETEEQRKKIGGFRPIAFVMPPDLRSLPWKDRAVAAARHEFDDYTTTKRRREQEVRETRRATLMVALGKMGIADLLDNVPLDSPLPVEVDHVIHFDLTPENVVKAAKTLSPMSQGHQKLQWKEVRSIADIGRIIDPDLFAIGMDNEGVVPAKTIKGELDDDDD